MLADLCQPLFGSDRDVERYPQLVSDVAAQIGDRGANTGGPGVGDQQCSLPSARK